VQESPTNYASLTARGLVPNRWDIIAFPLVFGLLLLAAKGAHETLAPLSTLKEPVVSLDPVNLPEYALRTTPADACGNGCIAAFHRHIRNPRRKKPARRTPPRPAPPNVWGIGECAGSPQFTHASVDDFRIIKDNLAGGNRSTRDRLVPYCMFTDPQLAHVGLTEGEAQRQGIAIRVARLPMSADLRTHTTDEVQGFMKALIGGDDRILGFMMIGSEAGEVMTAVQTAMMAKLSYPVLRDAVIAHLTIAEGLGPLLSNIPPRYEFDQRFSCDSS